MADNTQRFTGRVEDYDRFRQRYPTREITARLAKWCGLTPAWRIADVGAGTGMLAEVFLEFGARVIAIEPNPEMRAACARLQQQWPALAVRDATAEQTGLAPETVEMVAAGRAFHWFDTARALAEFRRIVRPAGWLTLVSLGRDHTPEDPRMREQAERFEQLLVQHGTDYSYIREGYRIHQNLRSLFPPEAAFHEERIAGVQELTWEELRGQTLSLSVAPTPEHPHYDRFLQALGDFFAHYRGPHGRIAIATACWITAAQLR